jgi:hypothetical protein
LFRDLSSIGVDTVKVAAVKPAGRAATRSSRHLLGYLPDHETVGTLKALGDAHDLHIQLSATTSRLRWPTRTIRSYVTKHARIVGRDSRPVTSHHEGMSSVA